MYQIYHLSYTMYHMSFYSLPGSYLLGALWSHQSGWPKNQNPVHTYLYTWVHLSIVQNPGWLFYIEDFTTQLYGDYFINHEIRTPIKQAVYIMESKRFVFVAHLPMGSYGYIIFNKYTAMAMICICFMYVYYHCMIWDWDAHELFVHLVICTNLYVYLTLPKANSSPLKIGFPKRKLVFQPFILRGYVSFREGISYHMCIFVSWLHQIQKQTAGTNGTPWLAARWQHLQWKARDDD